MATLWERYLAASQGPVKLGARRLYEPGMRVAWESKRCSCGCVEAHEVMSRLTSDGCRVTLDSAGQVWLAFYAIGRPLPIEAGRVLMGEVCLYTSNELTVLVGAAKEATKHGPMPATSIRHLLRKAA